MIMNFQTLVQRQQNKAVSNVVISACATVPFLNFHAHVTQFSSLLLHIMKYCFAGVEFVASLACAGHEATPAPSPDAVSV
jgi:hypothetical protein